MGSTQMIRVAALTSGRNVPSTRFRIRQFVAPLRSHGVQVEEHRPFLDKYALPRVRALDRLWTAAKLLSRVPGVLASRQSDAVWIERELLAGRFTLERFLPRRSVLDIDDAIWLTGPPGYSEAIAAGCRGVIAGNGFIAEHYKRVAERVWVVPTCVDTDVWVPRAARPAGEEWTIGWTGSASTLRYLAAIEEPLADFLAERPEARLLVVSDRLPELGKVPAGRWRFELWSPDAEVGLVQQMDVGLMPLPDSDWARGKCALKMLLYMSVGIPVVASPVGVSRDILARADVGMEAASGGDWVAALSRLFEDRSAAARMGNEGGAWLRLSTR